jgi:hypothetical protein
MLDRERSFVVDHVGPIFASNRTHWGCGCCDSSHAGRNRLHRTVERCPKGHEKFHARAFSSENTSLGTLHKFGLEPGVCKCFPSPKLNLIVPAWTLRLYPRQMSNSFSKRMFRKWKHWKRVAEDSRREPHRL